MIIAIAGQSSSDSNAIVAALAAERARSGRKVLVVDVGQSDRDRMDQPVPACAISARCLQRELEQLLPRYQDIVIDAAGRDGADTRLALIAANLVVVPLHVDEVDIGKQYQLVARLISARMFNLGLHVLFALVCGEAEPTANELAAARAYAAEVMSATLCKTVIHARSAIANGMADLYHDVFEQ